MLCSPKGNTDALGESWQPWEKAPQSKGLTDLAHFIEIPFHPSDQVPALQRYLNAVDIKGEMGI